MEQQKGPNVKPDKITLTIYVSIDLSIYRSIYIILILYIYIHIYIYMFAAKQAWNHRIYRSLYLYVYIYTIQSGHGVRYRIFSVLYCTVQSWCVRFFSGFVNSFLLLKRKTNIQGGKSKKKKCCFEKRIFSLNRPNTYLKGGQVPFTYWTTQEQFKKFCAEY